MNILTRFKDIMSANINAALDKCEDPAKMVDQHLQNLREDLVDVKKATVSVMAEEKRTQAILEANENAIAKYSDLAEKALKAGNENDACTFLTKKQSCETSHIELSKTYTIANGNAQKMRDMHDKLIADIQSLDARRATIKAKVAVAKTQTQINKIISTSNTSEVSMSAFERMEAKADRMLNEANAMTELNQPPKDEAAELENKYASASPNSVEDELCAMKQKLGL